MIRVVAFAMIISTPYILCQDNNNNPNITEYKIKSLHNNEDYIRHILDPFIKKPKQDPIGTNILTTDTKDNKRTTQYTLTSIFARVSDKKTRINDKWFSKGDKLGENTIFNINEYKRKVLLKSIAGDITILSLDKGQANLKIKKTKHKSIKK